ncbi:hypothetical protein BC829DRAFT_494738 [Chytridium lagenaria]|nr:hypothetical protein BC829DRAFT_494738 [Chytridium lagenaria]
MTWHRQRPSSPRQTLPIPTASRITILIAFIALLICQVIAQSTVTEVQSYNGYGNNKRNPTWGQAGTPTSEWSGLHMDRIRNVTDFLANWGLLLHMDIMVTERNHCSRAISYPCELPRYFLQSHRCPNVTISMNRSDYIGVNTATNQRLHVNSLSSFIDGSALYGHTNEKAMSMRSFRDGLLKSQNFSTGEFPVKGG